uniref:Uncharacterized protein n=1 Tax=Arundo donax TaxID=35708 RepID=A0A0A9BBW0_ARUDO
MPILYCTVKRLFSPPIPLS